MEQILDAVDFGAMVVGADGCVQFCNRWLRERARFLREPVGAALAECFGTEVHPRLSSAVAQALQRGHSSRLSTALHPMPLPLYGDGADGASARIRHAVDIISLPGPADTRRCLIQVRDMSESYRREDVLRRQQQRLQESERRLSATLDSAPIGMAVGPQGGHWRYVNRALCALLDQDPAVLLASSLNDLRNPLDVLQNRHADAAGPHVAASVEERWKRRDGQWLWVRVTRTVLPDPAGSEVEIITQVESIDDRKQRERETAAALAEKETLLREVYHRVKNNLQVIQSLLNLKGSSVPDLAARQALAETGERVRSMALVHEKLYQSSQLSVIDLADYLHDLSHQVEDALHDPRRQVTLQVDAAPVPADLNCAVPFGLLVTELLSNSFKHAFPEGRQGQIRIALRPGLMGAELSVADDGVGCDPDRLESGSLGLKLVHSLAHQLDGSVSCESGPGQGSRWTVRIGRLRGDASAAARRNLAGAP